MKTAASVGLREGVLLLRQSVRRGVKADLILEMTVAEPNHQVRRSLWIKGIEVAFAVIAAILGIWQFSEEFEVLKVEKYEALLKLEAKYGEGNYILASDCPKPEPVALPVPNLNLAQDAEMDKAAVLASALDELIRQAGSLSRHVETREFFERFDKWRSDAKGRLEDSQKLMVDAGWTSNENWAESFHEKTHAKRVMSQEPYTPQELRGFLEAGSQELVARSQQLRQYMGEALQSAGNSSSDLAPGGVDSRPEGL